MNRTPRDMSATTIISSLHNPDDSTIRDAAVDAASLTETHKPVCETADELELAHALVDMCASGRSSSQGSTKSPPIVPSGLPEACQPDTAKFSSVSPNAEATSAASVASTDSHTDNPEISENVSVSCLCGDLLQFSRLRPAETYRDVACSKCQRRHKDRRAGKHKLVQCKGCQIHFLVSYANWYKHSGLCSSCSKQSAWAKRKGKRNKPEPTSERTSKRVRSIAPRSSAAQPTPITTEKAPSVTSISQPQTSSQENKVPIPRMAPSLAIPSPQTNPHFSTLNVPTPTTSAVFSPASTVDLHSPQAQQQQKQNEFLCTLNSLNVSVEDRARLMHQAVQLFMSSPSQRCTRQQPTAPAVPAAVPAYDAWVHARTPHSTAQTPSAVYGWHAMHLQSAHYVQMQQYMRPHLHTHTATHAPLTTHYANVHNHSS